MRWCVEDGGDDDDGGGGGHGHEGDGVLGGDVCEYRCIKHYGTMKTS